MTLLAVAVMGLEGCDGGGPGPDNIPPTISNAAVAPPQLRFPGGDVTLTATVADPSGVAWVQATVTGPDRATETVTLTDEGNGNYRGTYSASANTRSDGTAESYAVRLRARDGKGNETPPPGVEADSFQVNAADAPPGKPTL
jgi:hypothetical protein